MIKLLHLVVVSDQPESIVTDWLKRWYYVGSTQFRTPAQIEPPFNRLGTLLIAAGIKAHSACPVRGIADRAVFVPCVINQHWASQKNFKRLQRWVYEDDQDVELGFRGGRLYAVDLVPF